MSKHQMEDGTVVDTELASQLWEKKFPPRAIGWPETLYMSSKGRYYLEKRALIGHNVHCEYVSRQKAAVWLLTNGHDLPEDLEDLRSKIVE